MSKPTIQRPEHKVELQVGGVTLSTRQSEHQATEQRGSSQKARRHEFKVEKTMGSLSKLNIVMPSRCHYTLASLLEIAKIYKNRAEYNIHTPKLVEMHSNVLRYKNNKKQTRTFQTTKINTPDKIRAKINSELNRLSLDKINSVIDSFFEMEQFNSSSFAKMLAEIIHDYVVVTPLYATLYPLLVYAIAETYSEEDTKDVKRLFLETIQQKIEEVFAKPTENISDTEIERLCGHAMFVGCLAKNKMVPLEYAYQKLLEVMSEVTPNRMMIAINMLLTCGKEIETTIPESVECVFGVLDAFSKDRSMPGRERYTVLDFLECRSNKWDVSSMVPQIYSLDNIAKRRENKKRQDEKAKQQKQQPYVAKEAPVIKAGVNRFAMLLSDSDEYEEEEEVEEEEEDEGEEFNCETMLREFMYDDHIADTWKEKYIFDLLFAIACEPVKNISPKLAIIDRLHSEQRLNPEKIIEAFPEVVKRITSPEYASDFKAGTRICAGIIAHFVALDIVNADQFPVLLPNYSLDDLGLFFEECLSCNIKEKIAASHFFSTEEFAKKFSPFEVTNMIPEDIIDIFPVYDRLLTVACNLEDTENDLTELEGLIRKEFPEEVKNRPEFVVGTTEFILNDESRSALGIQRIIPLLYQHKGQIYLGAEIHCRRSSMSIEDAAQLIRVMSSTTGFPVDEYKSLEGDEFHGGIAALL